MTSDFTAEYGRAGGGVVNVTTKSGTNQFHGSLYEFNRVSALAANTYQQRLPTDRRRSPASPATSSVTRSADRS